jgi:hypothetical protein
MSFKPGPHQIRDYRQQRKWRGEGGEGLQSKRNTSQNKKVKPVWKADVSDYGRLR